MKLPQVHFAVNVAGLASVVGSVAGFVVANPSCVAGAVPEKYGLAVTAVAGAIASFLPTKKGAPPAP